MNRNALLVLESLIATPENRSLELLKNPESDYEKSWAMCVPVAFNDALDIKRSERTVDGRKTICWTQGSSFSFREGDTIYDSPRAYHDWDEALKHINLFVQVQEATSVVRSKDPHVRSPGSLTFLIFMPNRDRTGVIARARHTLSQDDFVRFLITGPDDELKTKIKQSE
jgi:hypothetical protein